LAFIDPGITEPLSIDPFSIEVPLLAILAILL
jgi:hypothetical protein